MIILTYQLPALMALLSAPYFHKLGIRAHTATSTDDLVQRAAALQPQLIIVSGESADVSETLVTQLRQPADRSLVFAAFAAARYGSLPRSSQLDGVICLDDPEPPPVRTRLPSGPPWTRRDRRSPACIPVRVGEGSDAIDGHTVDVGRGGTQLRLRSVPAHGGRLSIRFHRSGTRQVTLSARPVWLDADDATAVRIGVHFLDLTYDLRKALDDLALWDVVAAPDGERICLYGELSEASLLWPLAARVTAVPNIDLGQLTRVNFAGIVRIGELLDGVPRGRRIRFSRVPAAVMREPAFQRLIAPRCTVESYEAVFECESCRMEVHVMMTREREGETVVCPVCAGPLSLDPLSF